jgi:hypothetical protein
VATRPPVSPEGILAIPAEIIAPTQAIWLVDDGAVQWGLFLPPKGSGCFAAPGLHGRQRILVTAAGGYRLLTAEVLPGTERVRAVIPPSVEIDPAGIAPDSESLSVSVLGWDRFDSSRLRWRWRIPSGASGPVRLPVPQGARLRVDAFRSGRRVGDRVVFR